MSIKQKIVMVTGVLFLGLGLGAAIPTSPVYAQDAPPESTEQSDKEEPKCDSNNPDCCAGVKTSIIGGTLLCGSGDSDATTAEDSAIWHLLIGVLNVMTAGIGIAAVGGIVYGALLYTTAEDKPEQTKKAIGIITNVVIGLVGYGLMFVLLNYLIPGGIFE